MTKTVKWRKRFLVDPVIGTTVWNYFPAMLGSTRSIPSPLPPRNLPWILRGTCQTRKPPLVSGLLQEYRQRMPSTVGVLVDTKHGTVLLTAIEPGHIVLNRSDLLRLSIGHGYVTLGKLLPRKQQVPLGTGRLPRLLPGLFQLQAPFTTGHRECHLLQSWTDRQWKIV